MRARSIYRLHRWVAIGCGVVLLGQLISGIVMMMPRPGRTKAPPPAPIDYRSMTLSPADALLELIGPPEAETGVTYLKLVPLLDRLLYEVGLDGGAIRLIDAESGDEVEIDDRLAAEVARSFLGTTVATRQVERLERHDLRWRYGTLPVYRVSLDDPGASVVYVHGRSGAVVGLSNRLDRVRSLITSLHELEPLSSVLGSDRLRRWALLLFAMGGIVTVATGYWLGLRRTAGRERPRARPL